MTDIAMLDPASELVLLRAALAAAQDELSATKMVLAQHRAVVSTSEAVIAALKLEIALLRREQYGRSAERTARLIDQMELQLEELESAATEDAIRAEQAVGQTTKVAGFDRRHPVKKPFPAHPLPVNGLFANHERVPRERVVIEAPVVCTCCGSAKIVKLGEDVTETLEVVPRRWKVICYPAGFCAAKAREGRPCGKSSPAGIADRSASRPLPSTRSRGVGRGRTCWP